jgi:hypothetical protein
MSPLPALGAVGGLAGGLLVALLRPAYADGGGSFQHCIDQAANHNGEPPTCTRVDGMWVASWPDSSPMGGGGLPGGFVFLMFLAVAIGVGITIWKVATAQKLARQSGMDPGLATQMTLLSDDGLGATYLASSLRQPTDPAAPGDPAASAAPTAGSGAGAGGGAEARLAELRGLLDKGLVTQTEYDERRTAIIDSV